MKNWRNRFCSGFLAAVMLASNLPPVPVFAAAEDTGLCEHHPDHIDCSYIPAVEAVPCSHVCSEESGCVDSCLHEHDETCGYTEAQDGMECDFFCTECNISTESPGMEATAPIGGATDETVPPTASPTEETEPPMVEVPAETTSPAEEPPEETTVPETTVPTVIDSGSCGDNATWTVYSDKSLVISGTGAVTSSPWLDGYSTVYSLIVEEGITEICGHAFRNMPNLVSAQLPQSLNTIPSYSFYYDTQLKNIQFSDNVEHIGEHAFSGTGFTSFAIPDSVTSEVYNIISGANLTELYIGAGSKISETHWPSISAMPSLQNYVVSADNPYFTAVDGVLYTKDLKTLVNHPDGRAGSFSIPDGVETINSYAFNHDVNITDIHIPASVTEITENQFRFLQLEDAKSLRDIHVDDNNTAFASEDGLLYNKEKTILYCCGPGKEGTVRVAEGTWELDSYAFLRCSMLTNVLLPDSLEYIGFGAFRKCTNLQNLVIPATVTGWGQFAFQECSSLQWLATSVKNGNFQQDFENCCSLTDVYYYGTEAEWNTNRISNYDYPVKNAVKHFNAPLPGTYSISYILNEGENSPNNPATYYNYAEDIILEEPSREGYLFNGWYLESDDSAPAEAPQIRRGYSSGNMTFRAEWTEITQVYSVTLDSQGGLIHGALTEFIPGNVTPLPKDVIRNDYIFLGWYEGDTKVTEIPADAEGDKVYVAHWQEKADIAIDVTMQSYAYDGEGKTFVLKDTDGNLLPVAYGADWLVPCDYTSVAMSFGQQVSPETGASTYHQGVDLDTGTGWPVWASRAGTVVKAGSGSASGNYVQINHGDGFQSVYMHLNSFYVSAGEYVNPGQIIGETGSTGVTTNDHLHFGISYDGAYVDPGLYVTLDGSEIPFYMDYSFTGAALTDSGLPYEPGTHGIRVTRPETATCKAVDYIINPAIHIASSSGECGYNLFWEFDRDSGILSIFGSGSMYDFSPEDPAPWHVYAPEIRELSFNGCSSFGGYAFADCTSLTAVTIPKDIYRIGSGAFSGCTALNTITFKGNSPSMYEDSFSGVTATAYYPAGWSWSTEDLKDYGGKITWIQTGEIAKRLRASFPLTLAPGLTGNVYANVRPWNAMKDCVFTVSDQTVLEVISTNSEYIDFKAIAPGICRITITERISGLQHTGEITVAEPEPISIPCSMELQVPEGDTLRYFSVTPEVSGTYQFSYTDIERMTLSYGGYGDPIILYRDGEWVDANYSQDDEIPSVSANLEAGITYTVMVPYYMSAYEQTSQFTVREISADSVEPVDLHFYSDETEMIFMPGDSNDHYESVHYVGTEPLTWTSSNPDIIEILEVDNEYNECRYTIHGEGTAALTVTNGILSDSMTITTKSVEFLELYVPVTKSVDTDYSHTSFGFVAPEAGRYAFAVTADDGLMNIGFHYSNSLNDVMFSHNGKTASGFMTLEEGDVCRFHAYGSASSYTVRVSKASAKPLSMKLSSTVPYPGAVQFDASFVPGNACEKVVSWEIDNHEIAAEATNPNFTGRNTGSRTYEVYQAGTMTVTAISESGLKASLTVDVDSVYCGDTHSFGEWIRLQDENGEETGRERRTCSVCGVYQERKLPPLNETVKNRVVLDSADLAGHSSVWIDGVAYALQKYADKCYVDLPNGNARTLTIYTYSTSGQSRYPVGMQVWMLENDGGPYTATRMEEFDNILQYSGMSIRVTGKKGIRMITSIEQAKKNDLVSGGLAGYTLREYGTAVAWVSQLTNGNPLVLGKSYTMSNYAYRKDVADPVFAYSGSLMQYTNVLVGFNNDQCKNELAMRPYMILEDENGETVTIYGGTVNRSIGYIAYQNRNSFEPETAEYAYIWDIIHDVYGDVYDDEFIHAWSPAVK